MRLNASDLRRALGVCGTAAALLLMASCGGGEQQQNSYAVTRIIAFGDETSVIVDTLGNGNGSKYSVNGVVSLTDPTQVCSSNPIWIQTLASAYPNVVFPQCNAGPAPSQNPSSRIRAFNGAMAADLSGQIDAQIADSGFQSGDLITVLVGVNDVIAQYSQYPALSQDTISQNLRIAGETVGDQVNRLASSGAKVIVSTIPDVGYSPFALAEKASHIDTDRQQLIIGMVGAFNAGLRTTILDDGHSIGLVTMDQQVENIVQFVGSNGFTNVTTGVCDLGQSLLTPPSILDCTDLTLIPSGNSSAFLWADDRHLSLGGQLQLGSLANVRAHNNPF
jgi:outer membrane lipase/esterase